MTYHKYVDFSFRNETTFFRNYTIEYLVYILSICQLQELHIEVTHYIARFEVI